MVSELIFNIFFIKVISIQYVGHYFHLCVFSKYSSILKIKYADKFQISYGIIYLMTICYVYVLLLCQSQVCL